MEEVIVQRSKMVSFIGSHPAELKTFLRSVKLAPADWEWMFHRTRDSVGLWEGVVAVMAMSGAMVIALGSGTSRSRRETYFTEAELIVLAGMCCAIDQKKTILIRIGEGSPLGPLCPIEVFGLDNSRGSRSVLIERLQSAGCPVDATGEGWCAAGDFG